LLVSDFSNSDTETKCRGKVEEENKAELGEEDVEK
jgi:hypothetical protein